MKQHPIPQNILDIEFKLFTKFTVKEFAYMSLGIGFGGLFLYFYTKNQMPAYVAFPVFLVSSGIGLFLGLVPINDQKADQFLSNYIAAITKPTQRVWKNDKFDQKVELLTNKQEEQTTEGSMVRSVNQEQEGTLNVIGGTPIPNHQFIEQQKIDEFDKAENERLAEIEKAVNETDGAPVAQPQQAAPTQQTQQVQQAETPPQQQASTAPEQQPAAAQVTTQTTVPAKEVAATPAQDVPTVVVSAQTAQQYALNIDGFTPQPNSINVQLTSSDGTPVTQAMVMVKNDQGHTIHVQQTNHQGVMFAQKTFEAGNYQLKVQHEQFRYPMIRYILDNTALPPVRVKSL